MFVVHFDLLIYTNYFLFSNFLEIELKYSHLHTSKVHNLMSFDTHSYNYETITAVRKVTLLTSFWMDG